MRRLIFVNRFFFPDHSATSQILSDLAFHFAGDGWEVHAVTGTQIYDDPQASLPADEAFGGVHIHRVASTRFGRAALLGRTIDYLSFYRSAWRSLIKLARQGDFIVAMTDPPLISLVAMHAARRTAAVLINWLQDLYPEIAVELDVPLIRGTIAAGLTRLRNRSLRAAAANVAVGQLMGERLQTLGVSPTRVRVIANWCDDAAIQPVAQAQNRLRAEWGLSDKFVFGYSGNLGRVHEFKTVLAAAELLREQSRIVFLMIGGGKQFDELASVVRARGLDRQFHFMPYQPREMLAYSLGAADVHWLSLNPRLEGTVVPSKFYGIAAAAKPIIAIGDSDGEIAGLVRKYDCGMVITTGDAAAIAAALVRLAREPESVTKMGNRARQMLDENFTRQKAFERWRGLLDQLDQSQGLPGPDACHT